MPCSKFKALSAKLGRQKGITNPDALAAKIGRKKLGQEEMTARSVAARRKKNKALRAGAKRGEL